MHEAPNEVKTTFQVIVRQQQAGMEMRQTSPIALVRTIYSDQFFTIDESQVLIEIREAFGSELERLKRAAVFEQATNGQSRSRHSPSAILFGHNYDEINRTLTGLLCLRWIYNNEYERFIAGQPATRRLSPKSFDWLNTYFRQNLQTPQDILPLVVSLIINDLGKDPNLEREVAEYFEQNGDNLPKQNHDSLLYEAAMIPGMINCLSLLNEAEKEDLVLGLELGSELNAGQLAQAESVPINLEFLRELRGREHAFELKYMEQILDVAGAKGHVDANGSINLIQPVFETFQTVHGVSLEIIRKDISLRDAYDLVLKKREKLLVNVGFRRLSVNKDEDRALLRLLTMGRTVDRDQAELFATAFERLDERSRSCLITGLNIDGNVNEHAVLPYYMPAVIADTLSKTRECSEQDRQRALTTLMRYLAKVFDQSPKVEFTNALADGVVMEHNMTKVKEVIDDPEFPNNLAQLDELDIPAGQQLLRRRTSHSMASSGESQWSARAPSRTGTGLSVMSADAVKE